MRPSLLLFVLFPLAAPFSATSRKESEVRRRRADRISNPKLSKTSPVAPARRNASAEKDLSARKKGHFDHLKLPPPNVPTQLDYARNGHAVVRSLLPPSALKTLQKQLKDHANSNMLQAYQQKVAVTYNDNKLAESLTAVSECQLYLERRGLYTLPFLQYFHTWRSISQVLDLATSLAPIAAKLMDCASIRLYQDSLFYKSASADAHGPTPWHVDARMAPFDTSNMVTFWIPLHNIAQGESGLVFCSKSHADFSLPFWSPYERDDGAATSNDATERSSNRISPWQTLEERYKHKCVDYMPLALGDVTVHSGWTLHCADGCARAPERWALAITFVDAEAPVRASASCDDKYKGDSEDTWSYQSWLSEVRSRQGRRPAYQIWHHPHVPVLWPPSKRTKLEV